MKSHYNPQYEVTFKEFDMFCDSIGSYKPGDENRPRGLHPVANVSWYRCIEFANWRSKQEGLESYYNINKDKKTGLNSDYDTKQYTITLNKEANGYRLPTEAEWEYAARECGKRIRFGNGESMARDTQMTFNGNRNNHPDPPVSYSLSNKYHSQSRQVGSTKPNALGIYDLSGNIQEWCWDWYEAKRTIDEKTNPLGPNAGKLKIYKGGSFMGLAETCRASHRGAYNPDAGFWTIGFRLVRSK
jgi:formylglycine-generating enzyme